MKKTFGLLFVSAAISLSFSCFSQETTKPDTVKTDKNKEQVLPPKSEATQEAPKKAETRDTLKKDSIPKSKNPKIIDRRREEKISKKKTLQKKS